MKNHLEVKRLRLRLRSPVHVGTRIRQYTPLEVVALGARVYKIHEEKLSRALAGLRLLDDFVIQMGRNGADFDLRSYLEQKRLLNPEFLMSVAAFTARAPQGASSAALVNFRPCARTGLGQPFLPGSSIKGAIRTALLAGHIDRMSDSERQVLFRQVERQLEAQEQRIPRERFAQPLLGTWLQADLPLDRRDPKGVKGPHRDLLRCLKVSDAHFAGETELLPVQILSLRRGDDNYNLKEQIWLECIPAGAELTCSLTLDRALLADFARASGAAVPFSSLSDILDQVEQFASQVLDEEFDYYRGLAGAEALEAFYDETDANLRIGLGSGLPATSIALKLPEPVRFRLRDRFFQRRDSGFFPKSRKVVVRGRTPVLPLGWVRFDVVEG